METMRFEDREWLEREFVRDDNGRIVPREEFEIRTELREALRSHNEASGSNFFLGLVQTVLLGGLIWGAALLMQ